MRETRVVGVDERARGERRDGTGEPARSEGRLERVEQREADGPLRLRAAPVERDGRDDVRGELVLDQEVADLRAVAVRQHDLVAGRDELGDVVAGDRDGL